ncbi:MAG: (Fe-S)-binding protein [Sulfurimonas sp.]|jgi:glycolate oxidase iron-sulfur subunit|nr:(Fe-S)-binding protein [Sulfurimonas sp.]
MSNIVFDFDKVNDSCIKCGKCIPTCTIHEVNPDEVTSPRGFLELLGAYKNGNLELDKNVKSIFESCFLCTNCVDVCPNDLPVDMLIEQVRNDIRKKFGLAWYKRAFFWLLRHRKIMDIAAKFGYVFQTCGFKMQEQKSSMQARFSLPMLKKGRLLPSATKKSFLNSHPDVIKNGGKGKIGIFIGCLANYAYTDIGKSLLEILKVLEIDVYLIKKQLCCGAPAYFTGDFDTVDYLAKHNIEYFEGFAELDAFIIPEATCSAMIKVDYAHYFHDQEEWKSRAEKLNPKIFMATEYLANSTKLKEILKTKNKLDMLVTYHDPCHARKMQGIYKEPRDLISENYMIKEMSDPNRCCGFGGVTIQAEKYDFALAAGQPKAAMIRDTKADIVSAECSACRMQIGNSMHQAKVDVIFKNPIELIAQALREGK